MLGTLLRRHALFELAEYRLDVLGERRPLEHVEDPAHRKQRVAFPPSDRDVAVRAILELRSGSAVDLHAGNLDPGVLKGSDVALDGPLARTDLRSQLGDQTPMLE